MKSAEIKDLSVKELQERIDVEKAQLSKLKSPIENPSIIKKSRRDIARMLTILRQKNPKC